ncbi:MAG TPA: hypothetical protein PLQ63_13195 [Propionicimonas sp.]|nr:hypothetical protein [Propionicimonas sp.]
MLISALVGTLAGFVAGLWAVMLWAASKAKGIWSDLLAVLLAVAPVAYYLLPATIAPKPGEVARSLGWTVTGADAVAMALALILVAALAFLLADRLGLTRRLVGSLSVKDEPGTSV